MSYARISSTETDVDDINDHVVEVHEDVRTLADVDADRSMHQPIVYPVKQQIAQPINQSTESASTDPLMISLTFLQQSQPNRKVLCNPKWTVSELKRQVFPSESAEGKLIRLIYLGRVLSDASTLDSLQIEQDHVIHAMITDKIPVAPAASSTPTRTTASSPISDFYNNTRAPAFIHTSPDQYNDADSDIDFNDERYIAAHAAEGEYVYTLPPEGTNRDFIWGFVLGLVLGFLALLFLWNSRAPRKQRLGILLGLMCYVVISSLSGAAQQAHVARTSGAGP